MPLPALCARKGVWILVGLWSALNIGWADDANPYGFEFRGVRTALRVVQGKASVAANRGATLLVVNYSIRNQAKYPLSLGPGVVRMEAEANGHRYLGSHLGNPSERPPELRPGGSVEGTTTIQIPSGTLGGTIRVRYGINGELELPIGPVASSGEAADEVEVDLREVAALGLYDVSVESFERVTSSPYYRLMLDPDEEVAVVQVSVRNASGQAILLDARLLSPILRDNGGAEISWTGFALQAGRAEPIEEQLGPGQRSSLRYLFRVRKDKPISGFRLSDPMTGFRSLAVTLR